MKKMKFALLRTRFAVSLAVAAMVAGTGACASQRVRQSSQIDAHARALIASDAYYAGVSDVCAAQAREPIRTPRPAGFSDATLKTALWYFYLDHRERCENPGLTRWRDVVDEILASLPDSEQADANHELRDALQAQRKAFEDSQQEHHKAQHAYEALAAFERKRLERLEVAQRPFDLIQVGEIWFPTLTPAPDTDQAE